MNSQMMKWVRYHLSPPCTDLYKDVGRHRTRPIRVIIQTNEWDEGGNAPVQLYYCKIKGMTEAPYLSNGLRFSGRVGRRNTLTYYNQVVSLCVFSPSDSPVDEEEEEEEEEVEEEEVEEEEEEVVYLDGDSGEGMLKELSGRHSVHSRASDRKFWRNFGREHTVPVRKRS